MRKKLGQLEQNHDYNCDEHCTTHQNQFVNDYTWRKYWPSRNKSHQHEEQLFRLRVTKFRYNWDENFSTHPNQFAKVYLQNKMLAGSEQIASTWRKNVYTSWNKMTSVAEKVTSSERNKMLYQTEQNLKHMKNKMWLVVSNIHFRQNIK